MFEKMSDRIPAGLMALLTSLYNKVREVKQDEARPSTYYVHTTDGRTVKFSVEVIGPALKDLKH